MGFTWRNTSHGIGLRHLDTLLNVGAVGGLTDAQLLELFTTGRDETAEVAFTVLVDRHGPMVLRVCQAVLRDSHDAQDAFQATFMVLVKKARGLWVRESLGPWLHQVAHRIASCARLANARRRRHEKQAASLSADYTAASSPDDLGEVLHREVSRLPERYRAAVVLCLLEGLTPEQAARATGLAGRHGAIVGWRGARAAAGPADPPGPGPRHRGAGSATGHRAISDSVACTRRCDGTCRLACHRRGNDGRNRLRLSRRTHKRSTENQNDYQADHAAGAMLALGVAVTGQGMLDGKRQGPGRASRRHRTNRRYRASPTQFAPVDRQARETVATGRKQDIIDVQPPPRIREVMIKQAPRDGDAYKLAISPDGKTIAAGCTSGSIHLLDATTGEKRVALADVPRGYIRELAFTPDGKAIAGACDDQRLYLWDAATGQLMKELPALGER